MGCIGEKKEKKEKKEKRRCVRACGTSLLYFRRALTWAMLWAPAARRIRRNPTKRERPKVGRGDTATTLLVAAPALNVERV